MPNRPKFFFPVTQRLPWLLVEVNHISERQPKLSQVWVIKQPWITEWGKKKKKGKNKLTASSELFHSLIHSTISKRLSIEGYQKQWYQHRLKLKICSSLVPRSYMGSFKLFIFHQFSSFDFQAERGCPDWWGLNGKLFSWDRQGLKQALS